MGCPKKSRFANRFCCSLQWKIFAISCIMIPGTLWSKLTNTQRDSKRLGDARFKDLEEPWRVHRLQDVKKSDFARSRFSNFCHYDLLFHFVWRNEYIKEMAVIGLSFRSMSLLSLKMVLLVLCAFLLKWLYISSIYLGGPFWSDMTCVMCLHFTNLFLTEREHIICHYLFKSL